MEQEGMLYGREYRPRLLETDRISDSWFQAFPKGLGDPAPAGASQFAAE